MGQLPQSEVIEGAIRKENRLVPEITIRELVANALIFYLRVNPVKTSPKTIIQII